MGIDSGEDTDVRSTVQYVRTAPLHKRPPEASELPDRIGRYDIVTRLGEGGMATVHLAAVKAELSEARRLVVVKVLRDERRNVKLFLREAKIAMQLCHPCVVATHDVVYEDGKYIIVMEYLEGVSLSALLGRARDWPARERWPLIGALTEALRGVDYLHEFSDYEGNHLRLVHRDLKPSNIFVTFDGQVKLLDFGIAKATHNPKAATLGHAVKGTARYMAPELVATPNRVERRADIYSAGMTLTEILVGAHPLAEVRDLEIMQALMAGTRPGNGSCAERLADQPAEFTDVVNRATAMNRLHRFATAKEMRNVLLAAVERVGVSLGEASLADLVQRGFGDLREIRKAHIASRMRELIEEAPTPAPVPVPEVEPRDVKVEAPSSERVSRAARPAWRRFSIPLVALIALGGVWHLQSSDPPPPSSVPAPLARGPSPASAALVAPSAGTPGPRETKPGPPKPVERAAPVQMCATSEPEGVLASLGFGEAFAADPNEVPDAALLRFAPVLGITEEEALAEEEPFAEDVLVVAEEIETAADEAPRESSAERASSTPVSWRRSSRGSKSRRKRARRKAASDVCSDRCDSKISPDVAALLGGEQGQSLASVFLPMNVEPFE